MASDADEEVTAAENSFEYPRFFICGIRMEPIAATSATAEPEISAKNNETPMFTIASPPRMKPMMAVTKLINRSVIPPAFMMAPASTNIGIAISENLVEPSYMSSAIVTRLSVPSVSSRPSTPLIARATAIGMLIQIMISIAMKIPAINIRCDPCSFRVRFRPLPRSLHVQARCLTP